MTSRQALALVLILAATGLIIALGGFLAIYFIDYAQSLNAGLKTSPSHPPIFTTQTESGQSRIIMLDEDRTLIDVIYTADITDDVADFELFAVPQVDYTGTIYLKSQQDSNSDRLIIYPLDVSTKSIKPAVLKINAEQTALSPQQNQVAFITSTGTVEIFDLKTGKNITQWDTNGAKNDELKWQDNACLDLISVTTQTTLQSWCQ
jgi:hypothetical protein